jgi:hypothetical protein
MKDKRENRGIDIAIKSKWKKNIIMMEQIKEIILKMILKIHNL